MRALLFSLALFTLACGGDSTGSSSGANVKIISVSVGGAPTVQNIGGSGSFYLEFWGASTNNAPGGGSTLVRIATSPTVNVSAGYAATLGNPAGGIKTRIVAKSQAIGGSGFFTSDCYGSC